MHRWKAVIALCVAVAAVAAPVAWGLSAPDPRIAFRRPEAIPFAPGNPYSPAKAALGRRLFFDTALSGPRDMSCASCHDPGLGWGDGRALPPSRAGGSLPFRSPTLLNLAWQGPMGWEGKFRDLETMPFGPIASPAIMASSEGEVVDRLAGDPGYAEAFAAAFGDPAMTRARVEAALGIFMRLVVSPPAPFDRWVAGDDSAVDASAKRGFALFRGKANCAACHTGWAMSDGSFHDIGLPGASPGRGRLFPKGVKLMHAHKTPGLRDLSRRAPYMHDGSLATLGEVVDHYDKGGLARPSLSGEMRPLNLSPAEKADLLAFLRSLESDAGDVPAMSETLPATPPVL